jgi:hypothetical protein
MLKCEITGIKQEVWLSFSVKAKQHIMRFKAGLR